MKTMYFDHCAATPIHPEVLQKFIEVSQNVYGNPSSTHIYGIDSKNLVEESRESIAKTLGVMNEEVIFTSGATESNNIAIFGVIDQFKKETSRPIHIIVSEIEHSSVYNVCKELENQGVEVTYLPVDSNGIVMIDSLIEALKNNTVLVSIMHVNNEIGSIQPIEDIAYLIKNNSNALLHVDGVQGFGKIDLNLESVDLYTLSGHKLGAPKGIGILVVKRDVNISPLFYGGGQEFGIRSGTLNTPSIVALAKAIEILSIGKGERIVKLNQLRNIMHTTLSAVPGLVINSKQNSLFSPHIFNFSYPGKSSALILNLLESYGVIASSQSACSSMSSKYSRVLLAMNNNKEIASSSVRVSYNETLTEKDASYLGEIIGMVINDFSNISIGGGLSIK